MQPNCAQFPFANRETDVFTVSNKTKGRTTYTPENPKTAVPPTGTSENRAAIWTAVSQHRFHFCSRASTPHQVAVLAKNLQKTTTKIRKTRCPAPALHHQPFTPIAYPLHTRRPGVAYPLPNALQHNLPTRSPIL